MNEESDNMQIFVATLYNSLHKIGYGIIEIDRDPNSLRAMKKLLEGKDVWSVIFRHEATTSYADL